MIVLIRRFNSVIAIAPVLIAGSSMAQAQTPPELTPVESVTPSVPPAAPAPEKKRRFPRLGPEVGLVYLLDSKTRARFGSTVTSFGLRAGDPTPSMQGKFGLDLSVLQADQREGDSKNELLVVSFGPEFKKVFIPAAARRAMRDAQAGGAPDVPPPGRMPPEGGKAEMGQRKPPPFRPYYGASLSLMYARVKVPSQAIDDSGLGIGGSVLAGLAFGNRAFVESRLRVTSRVQGYSFSGVGLTVGLRF